MIAALIHTIVFVTYAALGAGLGGAAYWMYDYSVGVSACLGAVFILACGLLHLAFAPREMRMARRDRVRIDNEIQALKDAQSATRQEIEVVRETMAEEQRARDEKLTRELRDIALLVTQFAQSARKTQAAAASGSRPAAPAQRSDQSLLAAVKAAIEDNRVEMHVQPIVTLPQRRVVFYEGYTRLRDASGAVILPGEFMRVAEPSGLVAEIDNLLLLRCVQIARRMVKQDRRTQIFCNLSPTSLADEAFFAQFIAFLRENRDLGGSIVFELGRNAFDRLSIVAERNMGRLFDLGFRFSIDRCESVDLDLRKLERMGVRYVKIAGDALVRQVMREGARPVTGLAREFEARDVSSLFARYGVDLIADRIESERTVVEILELDLHFGQGNLFGAPRPLTEARLGEAPETRERLAG